MTRARHPIASGIAAASLALAVASPARAHPQLSGGVTTGVALTDLRFERGPRFAGHLGGRFDLLLLRDGPDQMALGPYAEVLTIAFDSFETGGGLSWLIPAGGPAFIVSGGGFARSTSLGWEPGASATVFWGSRSYNYHSVYSLGLGLFVQGRLGFGDGKQADALAGVQVDLAYFALPFLFAYEALRH
jgi:hypothetical protein